MPAQQVRSSPNAITQPACRTRPTRLSPPAITKTGTTRAKKAHASKKVSMPGWMGRQSAMPRAKAKLAARVALTEGH